MKQNIVSIQKFNFDEIGTPKHRFLTNKLAEMIDEGDIEAGAYLPSRKDLAAHLDISIQTIRQSYLDLESRGYVRGEVGRGTRVLDPAEGTEWTTILEQGDDSVSDMSILRPVFSGAHAAAASETLTAIATQREFSMLSAYRPSMGFKHHRDAFAAWFHERGVTCSPEDVLITNGATHATFLSLSTLCEPGDTVLAPAVTDVGLIGVCRTLHLNTVGVAVDSDGPVPDDLVSKISETGARVFVITPTLANPMPFTLSDARRQAICKIAEKHDLIIIEDDCFSALVEPTPKPLVATLPERVFYLTTFSKVLMSGLRVGAVTAPNRFQTALRARLRSTTWMAAPLLADLVSRWIEDGTAKRLVEWQRTELKARMGYVLEVLPQDNVVAPEVALNAWIKLPNGCSAATFIASCGQRNVALTAPDAFLLPPHPPEHAVRMCIGAIGSRNDFEAAVDVVADALKNPSDILMDFA